MAVGVGLMNKFKYLVSLAAFFSMLSVNVSAKDLITLECPIPDHTIEYWVANKASFFPEYQPNKHTSFKSEEDWLRGYAQLFASMVAPDIDGIEIDVDFDKTDYSLGLFQGDSAEWSPAKLRYQKYIITGDAMISYSISRETLEYFASLTPMSRTTSTLYTKDTFWFGQCVVIEQPKTIF